MGYNICGLIVSKISGGGGGGEYSQINLFETTPVQYSVWQQYGLLLCPNCGKTAGYMSRTATDYPDCPIVLGHPR